MTSEINELVADSARKKLNLAGAKLRDEHFYASLPLCAIDAVFSIGVRYEGTKRTVKRWAKAQTPEWPMDRRKSDHEHTISDFVEALNHFTSQHLAEKIFENKQLTSTTNGILKAEAVRLFAIALQEAGIEKFADIENVDKLERAEMRITKMKGQTSGLSFDYFALLAGNQVVKADRMICRFVAEAVGQEKVSPKIAKDVVFGATALLKPEFPHLDTRLLDSEVWGYESRKSSARKKTKLA